MRKIKKIESEKSEQMFIEETKQRKAWWYLSFAEDTGDPATGRWLGACVLFDHGCLHALRQAWRRGINPGGQCLGVRLYAEHVPGAAFHDRLLNEEDVRAMWDDVRTVGEFMDQEQLKSDKSEGKETTR
jgi:hypothetical protein